MTTTHHTEHETDRAAIAQMRLMLGPVKGTIRGPDAREPFDHLMESVPAAAGVTYERAEVGGVGGWWCRPDEAIANVAILYLHGGGYVVGSARAYKNFVGQFVARANAVAFAPEYGLAPEMPFPAAARDAHAAYSGLARQGFTRIALAGDSAGGGLALALLSQLTAEARNGSSLRPSCAAVVSPWTDLALTGESLTTRADPDLLSTKESLASMARLYLAGQDPRDPLASPLYGKFSALPPVRIDVGEDDILLDDSVRYGGRLEREGGTNEIHIWQGMIHVFPSNVTSLKAAVEALDGISAFLQRELLREPAAPTG